MTQENTKNMPVPVLAGVSNDTPPQTAPEAGSLPARQHTGRWVKGQSGNPKGRQKGSRNVATHERLALEATLRAYLSEGKNRGKIKKALDRLIGLAADHGDPEIAIKAMKILADKVLVQPKQEEDRSGIESPQVHIVIENATAENRVVFDNPPQEDLTNG